MIAIYCKLFYNKYKYINCEVFIYGNKRKIEFDHALRLL